MPDRHATLCAESLMLRRAGRAVVDAVSLSFGTTGAVAIVGPNGAGKSSLLRMLAGLTPPSAGAVQLNGRALAVMPAARRARAIGYLPQHFAPHWDLSVAELVTLGAERADVSKTDAPAAARRAIADHRLAGMETQRWSTLSGGERARVLLAMTLVIDPPVFLADEPGASLDVGARFRLAREVAQRGRTRLCIVATHDLDLALRHFDRVVVMASGRIAADESPKTLIDDPVLDRVYGVAFARLDTAEGRLLHVVSDRKSLN